MTDRGEHYPTTPVQCARGWRETDEDAGTWTDHLTLNLLTEAEHAVIRQAGDLWGAICSVVADGPTRDADLRELIAHVHAIQHAVMAQAASRAHPDLYRALGSTIEHHHTLDYLIERGTIDLYPDATDRPAHPLPRESTAEVPDWYCTNSARGEGWGSRGDCPYCGHYMFDGAETVTEDGYREHYQTCPGLDHERITP